MNINKSLIVVLILTLGNIMSCDAQTAENIWAAMQAQLITNKDLIAYEISSKFEVPGDSGRESGRYKKKLTSIQGPVRSITEKSTDSSIGIKYSELDLGFTENFANNPSQLFPTIDSMEMLGKEKINDETYSVIGVHGHHKKGHIPITASVWISDKTSRPLMVKGKYENVPVPGMKEIIFSVDYITNDKGHTLPAEVNIAFTISIFFHTGEFSFEHRLTDWRAK